MTVETRVMTADELLRMPDDGYRYELVAGELRKMSPAGWEHTTIAMRIGKHLLSYVERERLGEVGGADGGFILARHPDTVRIPDVSFVRTERLVSTKQFFIGPPDLAIEVLSPSDTHSEVMEKTEEYLRAGTRAVVVVDPGKRAVHVHRASGSKIETTIAIDVLTVDEVVPGWQMPLAEIFTS